MLDERGESVLLSRVARLRLQVLAPTELAHGTFRATSDFFLFTVRSTAPATAAGSEAKTDVLEGGTRAGRGRSLEELGRNRCRTSPTRSRVVLLTLERESYRLDAVKRLSFDDYRSEIGIKAWVAAARVSDAPRTRHGISEALKFFQANMRALSPERALDFLRCMDLSRPVARVTLLPGERIIGYRGPAESQFKLFFSRPGRSAQNLGVNPTDRRFVAFNVRAPTSALESIASPAKDTWSQPREYMANGGATQLLLPNSFASLLVEYDSA